MTESIDWAEESEKRAEHWAFDLQPGDGISDVGEAIAAHRGFTYGALWQRTALFDTAVIERTAEALWLNYETDRITDDWDDMDDDSIQRSKWMYRAQDLMFRIMS